MTRKKADKNKKKIELTGQLSRGKKSQKQAFYYPEVLELIDELFEGKSSHSLKMNYLILERAGLIDPDDLEDPDVISASDLDYAVRKFKAAKKNKR